MASAAATLKDCLEGLEIGEQCANVISNVTAKPHDPTSVKEALVQQITAPVRWSQSIENLIEKDGVESFYEWGTGKVLSGLIKRVSKSVSLKAVSSVEELEQI
jgi:[acyl-carrier-protein] S-malonyltransferase